MDHDDITKDLPKGYDDTVSMDGNANDNHKASDAELVNNYERAMEIHPRAVHKEVSLDPAEFLSG